MKKIADIKVRNGSCYGIIPTDIFPQLVCASQIP